MKKLLITLAASLALAGCVTNPPANQYNKQFDVQATALRAELDSGKISRTTYYERLHDITLRNGNATSIARYRMYVADMIPLARKADSGQITKAEFEDESRRQHAIMLKDMEAEMNANAERKRRNKERDIQDLQQSINLMNANRTQPPAFAPSINCRSRNVYGTIHTDCN